MMILPLCISLCTTTKVEGQDIHFSQIDINPVLFNPSYSGFFEGNGRVGVNYRNQWASVSEPYQTFSLSAEVSLYRNKRHRFGVNVGTFAYSDHAGTLNYGTTAGDLILSAYHGIGGRGNTLLSAAASIGCGQSGFNPANAITTELETFETNEAFFTNVSAGIAIFHQFNDQVFAKIGFSGQHLNRPQLSYLSNEDAFLEPKYNGYCRFNFDLSEFVCLMPVAAMQIQKNYHEAIYGIDAKYYYSQDFVKQINFLAGILVRHNDAIIFNLGMDYNTLTLALSYDANISKLASASHTIGAFEIGVTYRFISSPEARKKAISCPTF